MNTNFVLTSAASLALLIAATTASAAPGPDRDWRGEHGKGQVSQAAREREEKFDAKADKRQDKQQELIRDAWQSGKLTREEVAELERQQRRINAMQDRYDNDGKLSKAERERIKKELERAREMIREAKHNDEKIDRNRYQPYRGDPRQAYPRGWDQRNGYQPRYQYRRGERVDPRYDPRYGREPYPWLAPWQR